MTFVTDKLEKLIEEKKNIVKSQKGGSLGANYNAGFIDGLNVALQAVKDAEEEFTKLVWEGWVGGLAAPTDSK